MTGVQSARWRHQHPRNTPIEALERQFPLRVMRYPRDESRAERLPDKCTIRRRAGDVVRMLTPGGGWGEPETLDT